MPKKKVDQASCKVCARLAKKEPGAKCKRHGGPSRSTSNGRNRSAVGGDGPAKTAVARNGHDPEIAQAIAALNAKILKLTEARDMLDALGA